MILKLCETTQTRDPPSEADSISVSKQLEKVLFFVGTKTLAKKRLKGQVNSNEFPTTGFTMDC